MELDRYSPGATRCKDCANYKQYANKATVRGVDVLTFSQWLNRDSKHLFPRAKSGKATPEIPGVILPPWDGLQRQAAAGMKVCLDCLKELPLSAYSRCGTSLDGKGPVCSDCIHSLIPDLLERLEKVRGYKTGLSRR